MPSLTLAGESLIRGAVGIRGGSKKRYIHTTHFLRVQDIR